MDTHVCCGRRHPRPATMTRRGSCQSAASPPDQRAHRGHLDTLPSGGALDQCRRRQKRREAGQTAARAAGTSGAPAVSSASGARSASCRDFTLPHAASLDPLTPGSASDPSTPVHADSYSSCWDPAVPYPLLRATTTPCLASADQFCRLQVTRIFLFVQRPHAWLGPVLRRLRLCSCPVLAPM